MNERILNRLRQLWKKMDRPQGAVWLPVLPPWGAFAELVILLGAIHLCDFLFPEFDLLNREPSPYWVPILLLSLQYGTVAGLMAAGAATLAYAMGGLPEQNIDEHHFSYLLRVWSLPILWISIALVLGQFRLRQIELKQQLKTALEERTQEAHVLAGYVGDLERRCRDLERELTSRGGQGGGGMLDALAALADPATDVPHFVDRVARSVLGAGQLSVYVVQANTLELVSTGGRGPAPQRRFASDHSLYRTIVSERQSVSVLEPTGERALGRDGLAAVPILHDDGGRVLGMLKVEQADGEALTGNLVTRLAVIASLLAPMLAEPRIVVDNTLPLATAARRLTRRRRHFSWQTQEPGSADAVTTGGGRGSGRPSRR